MTEGSAPDADVAADLARLAEIEADLHGVDAALRRLEDRTPAMCVSCGSPIEADVIVASPLTRQCGRCAPPPTDES